MTAVVTGRYLPAARRYRCIRRGREGFGHGPAGWPPPRRDTPGTVGYQLVDRR